jgi:hypothetical protein
MYTYLFRRCHAAAQRLRTRVRTITKPPAVSLCGGILADLFRSKPQLIA